jgi:hypothetical protein
MIWDRDSTKFLMSSSQEVFLPWEVDCVITSIDTRFRPKDQVDNFVVGFMMIAIDEIHKKIEVSCLHNAVIGKAQIHHILKTS